MTDKTPDVNERRYLIADLPPDQKPRERLLQYGSESLSIIELLGIILRNGRPGLSTLDLARNLLYHFDNDLHIMASANPVDLRKIKGIGPAKAAELKATFELASRLSKSISRETLKISTPMDVADYLRSGYRGKKQEELRCLLLDTKNQLIRDELITIGLLDRSQVHAREVFRPAIAYSAAKLVLAHNHPSGDPTPSNADINCTKELIKAGQLIGIEVVDHIIIGQFSKDRIRDYVSLKSEKLI
jgi:DNA repair protein RadC